MKGRRRNSRWGPRGKPWSHFLDITRSLFYLILSLFSQVPRPKRLSMSRHVDVVIVFSEIGFKFIDRKRKIITDFGMKKEKKTQNPPLKKKKKPKHAAL